MRSLSRRCCCQFSSSVSRIYAKDYMLISHIFHLDGLGSFIRAPILESCVRASHVADTRYSLAGEIKMPSVSSPVMIVH